MHRFWVEMWDWKTFAAAIATMVVAASLWFAVSDELKDRATAAAYAQTLKDQRVERTRTTKEIAELKDRVDILIRYIEASDGTVPAEVFTGTTTRRGVATTSNRDDDDDDDGDSTVTVNNPPAGEDKNPTPKAPETTPPDPVVEDLTKRVEDVIEDATDLSKNPLMGGTPK